MTRPAPTVLPCGDRGYLVELAGNQEVHVLAAAVRDRFADQVEDVVPGEETLLLRWAGDRPPVVAELRAQLAALDLRPAAAPAPREVTISVDYDGEDLAAVAASVGVAVDRLVELHSQARYVVAFMGFAPGFAYMTGGDPQLHLPRRDDPRPRVPAGSVAIASTYTAVYPSSGPGGWHLLGHTDAILFDPDREPPALLESGIRVAFEPR